jgi:hypothetical protein
MKDFLPHITKNICLYIFILENYSQNIFQLVILVIGHLGF